MKISIVIPAHNEEADIANAITAALAQGYHDFEVIVVDNASSDRTPDVASKFPVKLVREPRKGLLWAREAGRKAASGDIIYNMDADCRPSKDWLERAARYFNDGNVVAVTGPYDYYDAGGLFRRSSLAMQKHLYGPINSILQSPLVRNRAILIGGNSFIHAGALEKAGGYDTSLVFYGEDTDTAKRISKHGRVVFDRSLSVKTSARRFKAEGWFNLTTKYWFHFFKHIFTSTRDTAEKKPSEPSDSSESRLRLMLSHKP